MTKNDFAALHKAGAPLILFNCWDAGSAKAIASSGASAIATGSLALAGAQGFDDGEGIPFEVLLKTVRQIASVIDLPLSVDIETGFADSPDDIASNAAALIEAGAIGCNLEDRLLPSGGLRDPAGQAARISAASDAGLFVNARTDLFLAPLMAGEDPNRIELVDAAAERAAIYGKAGAGCLFAPGLSDPSLIASLCERVNMPVNVMRLDGMVSNSELAKLGVARISYGPGPWRAAMEAVADNAKAALSK
ncbi:isocitrate lyase/phosphoenolpyruvate mutase family protein [Erythrobacter sp. F6033]|uniref:isocitrate lyase/PEP mutase family protein n=1 Tax=Erythrobacter sp. F6033 TaxID=2926401 RepID=UPI001FF4538D|nr:isocitrate lyase/phosphoenolpyruvate mutase family protein [Erythrobacter sp. F6033]MCK0127881.1 isocitrate lyase/phosphoenolpyruvate mutase family protein [Erythrobacter sp. F6033]